MRIDDIRDGIYRLKAYLRTGDESITGCSSEDLSRFIVVRRYGDLMLVNYTTAAQYDAEWNSFLRVCRGIVLDSHANVVSFPFHKFFNIDEHAETGLQEVAGWQYRSITEKIDGVMIQVFRHRGEVVFASRHGIGTRASQLAAALATDIDTRILSRIDFRNTLICELIHPEVLQPGMISYSPGLQLLVPLFIRNLETLELIPARELLAPSGLSASYSLPQDYHYDSVHRLIEIARHYTDTNWEGVVVQGHGELGNQLVKIKAYGYLHRLQILRGLSPRRLIEVYRQAGMEGVKQIIADVEEVVSSSPIIHKTITLLQREEENMRLEVQKYADVPKERITEVPVEWRWVVSYRGTEKFERAIRKRVAGKVESLVCKKEEESC
jgi:hypothetical protein